MASVHVEALRRAAEILGGKAQLRAWLHVSMSQLDAWMRGSGRPPSYVFLKVVDLISAEANGDLADSVRRSREARRKAGLIQAAAQATRERAASIIDRSMQIREALLERGAPEGVVRRRAITAWDFAAMEFSASDGRLILDAALNAAVNSTGATRANVQMASPEGLRLVAHIGFQADFLEFFATVDHRVASCCGRAHQDGQRVVVSDVLADPIFVGTSAADVMGRAGALSCQSTPLRGARGELIGMLSTHCDSPHEFTAKELEVIDVITQRTSQWLGGLLP